MNDDVNAYALALKTFLQSDPAKAAYLGDLNDDSLRYRVTSMVIRWTAGWLREQKFNFKSVLVSCDVGNNTREVIERGELNIDVSYAVNDEEKYMVNTVLSLAAGMAMYKIERG